MISASFVDKVDMVLRFNWRMDEPSEPHLAFAVVGYWAIMGNGPTQIDTSYSIAIPHTPTAMDQSDFVIGTVGDSHSPSKETGRQNQLSEAIKSSFALTTRE